LAVLAVLLRSSFRHRWRSWLALCLLIALVSGLVLAATAAGRRSDSAFSQFEAAHGYDAFLYSVNPLPKVATLPDVTLSTRVQFPTSGRPTCACSRPINLDDFSLFEVPPKGLTHMVKLESGRMPDQSDPDQVLASFSLAQDDGVQIGTVIRVTLASRHQRREVLNNATIRPAGPTVALRVVGIEASEIEFPSGGSPSYDLYTTSAFARKINPETVILNAYFVRLRQGPADYPAFQARAKALSGLSVTDIDNESAAIERSIHPQAVGWWILAGLAALVGIIVVGQALARQASVEGETNATLSALGVSRRQLLQASMARTVLLGVVGTAGGVLLAFLISPLTVVGEVKLADPTTGFAFDTFVAGHSHGEGNPIERNGTHDSAIADCLVPGRRGRSTEPADRSSACARTGPGAQRHSRRLGLAGFGSGCHGVVCDGRLRCQSHPPDQHARPVRPTVR